MTDALNRPGRLGKGRSDVPSAWAAALKQVLEPVDPSRKVAQFVVTGQHAAVLLDVKNNTSWVYQSTLQGALFNDAAKKAIATFYAGLGGIDAAVLRRWGRVLDAAWETQVWWGLTLGDVAGCHWPELMLEQAAAGIPSGPLPFTFADLERIAAEDATPAADLVRMAFTLSPHRGYRSDSGRARGYLSRLPGLADAVVAHRDVAASALVSGSVDERVAAASLLGMLGDPVLGALAEPFAEAATSTSAQVRDAARPLLARIDGAAVDPLRRLAADGKPAQRAHALELLAARPDQRAWALQAAAADRAASVRALSARFEKEDAPAEAGGEVLLELPPLPSWSLAAADAERVAIQVFGAVRRGIESENRRWLGVHLPPGEPYRIPGPPSSAVASFADLLAADRPVRADAELEGMAGRGFAATQVLRLIEQRGYGAIDRKSVV